mmetsp:Transcript_10791/g.30327  ORF Transcript_10791/g.30327 Transcript_10791/m.30327 type:complete len:278 (+) Transcript_10791:2245-3078(+)
MLIGSAGAKVGIVKVGNPIEGLALRSHIVIKDGEVGDLGQLLADGIGTLVFAQVGAIRGIVLGGLFELDVGGILLFLVCFAVLLLFLVLCLDFGDEVLGDDDGGIGKVLVTGIFGSIVLTCRCCCRGVGHLLAISVTIVGLFFLRFGFLRFFFGILLGFVFRILVRLIVAVSVLLAASAAGSALLQEAAGELRCFELKESQLILLRGGVGCGIHLGYLDVDNVALGSSAQSCLIILDGGGRFGKCCRSAAAERDGCQVDGEGSYGCSHFCLVYGRCN